MDEGIPVISTHRVYDVLDAIRRNHVHWLTSKSITALQNFLNGYMFRVGEAHLDLGKPSFAEFPLWALLKHDSNAHQTEFDKALLPLASGDEERAFEQFFLWLDEYRNSSL